MKSKKEISEIFDKIYNLYPNFKTELYYKTDFQLVLAVVMSAQATDKQVNKINKEFFEKVENPDDLAKLSLDEIEKYLKSLNYYKNKSKYIKNLGEILYKKYNSEIPNNLEILKTLPGIGIKTAKVILGVLYDAPYIGVDTHIHRISNRIGFVKTKTPEQTDKVLEKKLTLSQKRKMHHALVLFGRYNCPAIKPKCEGCAINNLCDYYSVI
ncbi:endonuclease III [Candidatus Gracilibacteria bacterium]|nr:endonuclease III [Candidatus Gracilibacteria bacterium]